jgi:hypothetical protein
MNDAPVDVGSRLTRRPAAAHRGTALPLVGVVAFLDHNWSDRLDSAAGYSMLDIDNTNGGAATRSRRPLRARQPALHPVKNVMLGPSSSGRRDELLRRLHSDDFRIQFSLQYNFSHPSEAVMLPATARSRRRAARGRPARVPCWRVLPQAALRPRRSRPR